MQTLSFIAKHALKLALLLVATSVVVFVLVGMSPIDPVQANVGQAAYVNMGEAKRAALASYWGSDTPIWERYLNWASAALQGDFGTSLRYNQPVVDVVLQRSGNTLLLMACAWVVSGVLGLALGIAAGMKRDTWVDKAVRGYCFVLASTPTFWLALLMLIVFAVWLGWAPIGFSMPIGKSTADITLADTLSHLALPAITLSVVGVANIALHTREKVIDIMESDYVRFARTRGESDASLLWHHGMRNLALPAITLQCASVSELFGGSVLVEQVFSYPGLGQAAVTAGLGGDAALLVGIALASAVIVFGGNLAANVLYGIIDPRIKAGEASHAAA